MECAPIGREGVVEVRGILMRRVVGVVRSNIDRHVRAGVYGRV